MIALLALACATAPAPSAPEPPWVERYAERMHTPIVLRAAPSPGAEAAADAAMAAFSRVEATANEWEAGSPLAAINAAGGQPVAAPADLRALVRRGVELAEISDGAFDPTWAALWGLWDFRNPRVPAQTEVAARLPHVGWRGVVVDDAAGTVRLLDPEAKLGLGGIAKGWSLDLAAAELRSQGVEDFVISAGGQVMAGGHNPEGRAWRVGVRDPRGGPDDSFAAVEVTDGSVSTSGDYERFFEQDGVRYHHILDPRTGWPARGLRSATVVSSDATTADALSTALMVLGAEAGLALAARVPEVDGALTVDDRGEVRVYETPRARFLVDHPPRP